MLYVSPPLSNKSASRIRTIHHSSTYALTVFARVPVVEAEADFDQELAMQQVPALEYCEMFRLPV